MDNYENKLDELAELYKRAGTEAQKLAAPIMNEAAFQAEELKKLRAHLVNNGWTSDYSNGYKQHGTIQSAEGKTYIALVKTFNSTVKTLYSILDGKIPEPEDSFTKFVKKRETR